jgi:predicted RNase H-like HicB family nuclease
MKRVFPYIVEKDEDGYYVASVPQLPGCHTQAKTIEELERRVKEAIELYLEENKEQLNPRFIGIQFTEVSV